MLVLVDVGRMAGGRLADGGSMFRILLADSCQMVGR